MPWLPISELVNARLHGTKVMRASGSVVEQFCPIQEATTYAVSSQSGAWNVAHLMKYNRLGAGFVYTKCRA